MTGSNHEFHGPAFVQYGPGSVQEITTSYTLATSPLDRAADKLAEQVYAWWDEEAGNRGLLSPAPLPVRWQLSEAGVTARVAAATAEGTRRRFTPLPGATAVTEEQLRAGGGLTELFEVYAGLASGRILLVGPEGSGKTAAVVLLLLDALRHRQDEPDPQRRARIPVPVLMSLNGWEPQEERPIDWAVRRLSRRHGHNVRELLKAGRIALLLDGFDEVAKEVRADAVAALAAAPYRVLLVSRTVEALHTPGQAQLGDAVALALRSVRPADAADHLLRLPLPDPVPEAWRELTRRLVEQPNSAVAKALTKPLALSLLRELGPDSGTVEEILGLRGSRAVEDRLLDHAVRAAYTPRPGCKRPRYSPEQAERTLRYIAGRLTEENTYDLRWWQIPCWGRPRTRALVSWLLTIWIYLGISTFMFMFGTSFLTRVTAVGVSVGAGIDLALRLRQLNHPQPLQSAGWRDVFPRGAIAAGVATWLGAIVVYGGTRWFLGGPPPVWMCFLITVPFGLGTAMGRGRGATLMGRTMLAPQAPSPYEPREEEFLPSPTSESRVIDPSDVWRHHVRLRLPLGLMVGAAIGSFWGCVSGDLGGLVPGIVVGVMTGLGPAVRCGVVCNLAVATSFTAVQLSRSEGTPVRLMSFLKDAHERNLLRATGPVYQFRHARLQERLARPAK
ncbi:NACHT domain-containing protein [Streptomyces diastatochromogenes]|uniref:hypothetical protein n=1 Tax=Streptomyces diastatochromogenes TaxID=42236 RepID=UPI0036B73737